MQSYSTRVRLRVNASKEALIIRGRLKLLEFNASRYVYESVLIYLHSGLYKNVDKDYCNILESPLNIKKSIVVEFATSSHEEGPKVGNFIRGLPFDEQRRLVMNALYYKMFVLDKVEFSLVGLINLKSTDVISDDEQELLPNSEQLPIMIESDIGVFAENSIPLNSEYNNKNKPEVTELLASTPVADNPSKIDAPIFF